MEKKQLIVLSKKVADNITDLFELFGVDYTDLYDRITCVCPIHEGADNPQAFTITTTEGQYYGCWRCWTHGCEKKFLHTPIGLIRGLLTAKNKKEASFQEAINFSMKFTESSKEELAKEGENFKLDKPSVNGGTNGSRNRPVNLVKREVVRKSLVRPVKYYLNRGYKESTLDKFDVGMCLDSKKLMKGRIVVPVYDDQREYMVGCVGRTPHENSNGYKWINSKHFNSGSYLYGYWFAKDKMRELKTVLLVEGQGDVWRLYESGITNAVGMFGSSLSDGQSRILETSGVLNLIVLTDNDEAGKKAKKSIIQKCERLFHINCPDFSQHDIGDMSVEEINKEIKPQLEGMI